MQEDKIILWKRMNMKGSLQEEIVIDNKLIKSSTTSLVVKYK